VSDEARIVYSFRKGSRSEVRASVSTYRGVARADIRLWVPSESDEGLIPTKSGISIPLEDLDELLAAVQALVQARREAA
jgi:hypothetical protein